MLVLLDTGILLRLFERLDPHHRDIQTAVKLLWNRGDVPAIVPQNAVEFWNVSTRPSTARGGYGQSVSNTLSRLNAIERICRVLPETPPIFAEWKRLVVAHTLTGVSVHDARIVAAMTVAQVNTILTLNAADFRRYSGIVVQTPADLVTL